MSVVVSPLRFRANGCRQNLLTSEHGAIRLGKQRVRRGFVLPPSLEVGKNSDILDRNEDDIRRMSAGLSLQNTGAVPCKGHLFYRL